MEVCLGGRGPLELESGAWLRATERPKLAWKEGTLTWILFCSAWGPVVLGQDVAGWQWILVFWAAIKTAG